MNALEKYISKYAGSTDIEETEAYWTQCVALVKHYSNEVIWVPLGSFWGTARTGWDNESNTFPASKWDKVPNDITKPDQLPNIWDIIFIETPYYADHTAIVRNTFWTENKIEVFEQNTGNWDGEGYDDRARVNTYTYNNVLGWYSPKNFYIEFKWVPVYFIEPKDNIYWYYGVNTKAIYITPAGRAKEDLEILMEHEWSHKIYWADMSVADVKLWEWVSKMDWKTQSWINKYMPWNYWINKYISPWETNESEDFAETWEDICRNPNAVYGDNRDFDRMVVQKIINKYESEPNLT
jgi:hypothetical protein